MAERLLKHALSAESPPLNQLEIQSAGIAASPGYPASANSIAAMKKVGIELSDHVTRPATPDLLSNAELIFGMTTSHLESVRYYLGNFIDDRLFLMRNFLDDVQDKQIPDPFGRGFIDYEFARDSMVEAIPSLINFLKSKYSSQT